MKYSNKYSVNSPLYIKLRSIYETKKSINNSKMSRNMKLHMMNECDCEANLAWRRHYDSVPGYELLEPRPMTSIGTVIRKLYHAEVNINKYNLNAKSDSLIFLVVPPHDKMKKWLLRIAPLSTFDRWANSTVIERELDNPDAVKSWLADNGQEVYSKVLRSLSGEVIEMKQEMDELRWGKDNNE